MSELHSAAGRRSLEQRPLLRSSALDRLQPTASSHDRAMILEVMGRDAGWIALHAAVAGGAEVCLIPEIPYDIEKVKARIEARYQQRRGFAIVVIAFTFSIS